MVILIKIFQTLTVLCDPSCSTDNTFFRLRVITYYHVNSGDLVSEFV